MCLSSSDSPANDDDSDVQIFYPDIPGAMKQIELEQIYEEQYSHDYDVTMDSNAQVWMLSQSMVDGEGDPFKSIPSSFLSAEKSNTNESVLKRSAMLENNTSTLAARNARDRFVPCSGFSKRSIGSLRHFSSTNSILFAKTSSQCATLESTPYDVLHIPKKATRSEIKSSYYALVKELHPDTASPDLSDKEKNARLEKFRTAVKAYELLMDNKKRSMYDQFGVGWADPGRPRSATFRPRSDDDVEHWQMWTEILRRAKYRHGASWQRMAQNPYYQYHFYGYTSMTPEDAKRQKEATPLNQKIFVALFVFTSVLTVIQIGGLRAYGTRDSNIAIRHNAQIAQNLEDARQAARSEEGLQRQRQMLERAREHKRAREEYMLDALPASSQISQ
jgi:DnaJ-domain-containing protein 1